MINENAKQILKYTPTQILEVLLGNTNFWGETNHDADSIENMKEYLIILFNIMEKLYANYNLSGDVRYSAQELRNQAKMAYQNIIEFIPQDILNLYQN